MYQTAQVAAVDNLYNAICIDTAAATAVRDVTGSYPVAQS